MKRAIITDQVDMDFERAAFYAERWGFQYLEIHSLWGKTVECLSDDEVDQMAQVISKYHLKVSCLSTTLFLMCPLYRDLSALEKFSEEFITYDDTYEHHLEKLEWAFDIAKRVGATCLRIFPFRVERGEIASRDIHSVISNVAERLAKPVQRAEHHKLLLVIENCPHSYLPRGITTFYLSCAIGSPSLRLLWDVGNSFRSMEYDWVREYSHISLLDEYQIIKSRIFNIHVKDIKKSMCNQYQLVVLGDGDIPYRETFERLKEDCYSNFVTIEPELYNYDGVFQSVERLNAMI